jgi:hypothetical protein
MNFIEAVGLLKPNTKMRRKAWLLMDEDSDSCVWLSRFKESLEYSIEELRKEDVLADDWEVVE